MKYQSDGSELGHPSSRAEIDNWHFTGRTQPKDLEIFDVETFFFLNKESHIKKSGFRASLKKLEGFTKPLRPHHLCVTSGGWSGASLALSERV